MTIEIFDDDQGSTAWFMRRMGLPTASMFSTVMAHGKGGGESKTRKTYLRKLAGEILTGEPMESFTNPHLERGKVMEAEAREAYAFLRNAEPQRVGFIRNGRKGCSPDALLEANGSLEIKTQLPHLLIETLTAGDFPSEHVAQCQGVLWVAEREWIDLVVYWPKLPMFVRRMYRDEAYISKMSSAVDAFNVELLELVETVKRYENA